MASTMKFLFAILLAFISLSKPFTLFSAGKKEVPPVEIKVVTDLQDKYNALVAPGIVMLPISGVSSVSSEFLVTIEKELNKQLVNAGKVKPVRMQNWLVSTYKNKANNPFVIMNAIKAEEYTIPLNYIAKPVVFRGGNHYYFVLYVYSLQTYYPVTILRRFNLIGLSGLEDILISDLISSCTEELYTRLSKPAKTPSQKQFRLVIDDFKLEFLRLAKLPSGEFEFISAPFFETDNTTLRAEDDFFSRLMGYILATTDMFQTFQIGDFKEHSNSTISTTSTLVDYRLQGRVQLSEQECVLYVDLVNVHTGAKTVSLRHPLLLYSFEEVWSAYRELSVQIIMKLFEADGYGIVPTLKDPGHYFFANNMFVGWGTLENYVLPKGLHIISTEPIYAAPNKSGSENGYHVLLDYKSMVFTDAEGKHVWNLLRK